MSKSKPANFVEAANDMVASAIESATTTFSGQPNAAKENLEAMTSAANLAKSRIAELQLKSMEIAETNTKAAFAFARDVLSAKSPETFVTLQQDFFKSQQEAALRQFQEVNSLTLGLFRELAAPVQDGFNKAVAQFTTKQAA